jgi:hypothetical protein
MRIIRRIRWIIIAVVALLAVVGALAVLGGLPFSLPLDLNLSLSRTERTTWTEHVFLRARDVYRFHTLEVVQKLVFPHDFFPPNLDWRKLLDRRGDPYSYLTTQDRRYLTVYDLARQVGIDPRREDASFLVVTVRSKIGFDLSDTVYARETPEPAEVQDRWIRVEETEAGRTAYIRLPAAAIQELIIEDPGSSTYPYPDVPMPPEDWRRVSEFVAERARERIRDESLAQAQARAAEFLTTVLRAAGFDEVHLD